MTDGTKKPDAFVSRKEFESERKLTDKRFERVVSMLLRIIETVESQKIDISDNLQKLCEMLEKLSAERQESSRKFDEKLNNFYAMLEKLSAERQESSRKFDEKLNNFYAMLEKLSAERQESSRKSDEKLNNFYATLEKLSAERQESSRKADEEREKSRKEFSAKLEESSRKSDKERAKFYAMLEKLSAERQESSRKADEEREKSRKEFSAKLEESSRKADEERAKSDKRWENRADRMDKQIQSWQGKQGDAYGRFVEALVAGDIIKLLREKGFDISAIDTRVKYRAGEDEFEIDIVAYGQRDVIITEVKSRLSAKDVQKFIPCVRTLVADDYQVMNRNSDQQKHNLLLKGKNVLAMVAFLGCDDGADIYARKRGLLVARAVGNSALIDNSADDRLNYFQKISP